jgi:hypothetical protein
MTENAGQGQRVLNAPNHRAEQSVNSQNQKDLIGSNWLSVPAIQIERSRLLYQMP